MNAFKATLFSVITSSLFMGNAALAADNNTEDKTSPTARLSVTIENIATPNGSISAGLFRGKDGYDSGKGIKGAVAKVSGNSITFKLTDFPTGEYGIKLFHDVNGDGEMNTNLFGMPIEPFAFSNSAVGSFGPAAWDDAKFTVNPGDNAHTITFK